MEETQAEALLACGSTLKPPGTAVIVESMPLRAYDAAGDGLKFTKLVMAGNVLVPVAVPIVSHFRLWRLDDGRQSRRSTMALLAVQPKKLDISTRQFAIGALVHESASTPRAGKPKRRCLIGVVACPV